MKPMKLQCICAYLNDCNGSGNSGSSSLILSEAFVGLILVKNDSINVCPLSTTKRDDFLVLLHWDVFATAFNGAD